MHNIEESHKKQLEKVLFNSSNSSKESDSGYEKTTVLK